MRLRLRVFWARLPFFLVLPCIFLGISCSESKNRGQELDSGLSASDAGPKANSPEGASAAGPEESGDQAGLGPGEAPGDESGQDGAKAEAQEDEAAFRLIMD